MLISRLCRFFKFPAAERLLLAEAFILTGTVRLGILLFSFRRLAVFMEKGKQGVTAGISETMQATAIKVGGAVKLVSRYTPWQSKCLVQALAAYTMLKRRRIKSTMYLGVARDGESNLIAHAWLRSGTELITGGLQYKCFTVVARLPTDGEVKKP